MERQIADLLGVRDMPSSCEDVLLRRRSQDPFALGERPVLDENREELSGRYGSTTVISVRKLSDRNRS